MPYETENFKRKDLMTLFRITRIINFMKEIRSLDLQPAYQITKNKIVIDDKIMGNETRLQVGLALFELLTKTKQIYGVKKQQKNHYELRQETVNPGIIDSFSNYLKAIGIC